MEASVRARGAIAVLAVVALAILMRLPGLLHDGLWRDQANLYVQVGAPTFEEFFNRVRETEWHPPLYFLIDYAWVKLAGESELAFTSLPFLFGIATVPVVYALGKAVASVRVGLLSASIYAVAPFPIAYAAEYLYPMMGFLSVLLMLLVVRAVNATLTPGRWVAVAFVASCAVYTHYTSLIFVPLLVLWSLWRERGRPRALALALLAGTLPFALWLPVFLAQLRIGIPYQLPPPGLQGKISYALSTLLQFMPARPERLEIALAALFAMAFLTLAWRGALNREACTVGGIFFAMLFATTAANLTTPRYVVPYFGLLAVFLAWVAVAIVELAWARLAPNRRRWLLPACTLVAGALVVGDVQAVLHASAIPKSGIRTFVAAQSPDRRLLYVIAPDYLASTFAFYARGADVRGFVRWRKPEIFRLEGYAAAWNDPDAVPDALRAIATQAARHRELDFVLDDSAHDEGEIPYAKARALLDGLRIRYRLLARSSYAGRAEPISVYRFELTTT